MMMMRCIAITGILSVLAATCPAVVVVEAFMVVGLSSSPVPSYNGARRQHESSSSFALAATPKHIQAWAASAAALMTVMSFSQIATAAVQPTEIQQQYPSTTFLVAAGAYQPESGYATLDLGFPKYAVEDGPAFKDPQGVPGGILGVSKDDAKVDLSTLDPKQVAKLEAKRQEAAQRAKMEQEKQMSKLRALAVKQQAKEAVLEVQLAACESGGNLDDLDLSPNEKSKLLKKCNAAAVRKQKEEQKLMAM